MILVLPPHVLRQTTHHDPNIANITLNFSLYIFLIRTEVSSSSSVCWFFFHFLLKLFNFIIQFVSNCFITLFILDFIFLIWVYVSSHFCWLFFHFIFKHFNFIINFLFNIFLKVFSFFALFVNTSYALDFSLDLSLDFSLDFPCRSFSLARG